MTDSMQRAIDETERRRQIQSAFNAEHHITPRSIEKSVYEVIEATRAATVTKERSAMERLDSEKTAARIYLLEEQMKQAAMELDFEKAAILRDKIYVLRGEKRPNAGKRFKR